MKWKDNDSLLNSSLHLIQKKIERKRVYIICVFMAQFQTKAWSVSTTVLMINLKRADHSFEVVSLLDCAFDIYFSLSLSFFFVLFDWPLRSWLFFEEWRWRLPSSPSAWPHILSSYWYMMLYMSIYPSFVQTMPLNDYSLTLSIWRAHSKQLREIN
jgi:hypothetical protein